MGVLEAEGSRYRAVAFECVQMSKNRPLPERLKEIYGHILDFVEKHRPDVMALENVFYGENVSTLVKIGEARAAAMLAAEEKRIPVVEYPPARVKQAVSGSGRASKVQIQHMMKSLLGLGSVPPVDAADALAVALCHIQSQRIKRFQERIQTQGHHVRVPVG